MNLALFYVWEDTRVWADWNHSFDMHLNHPGPVSYFSTSWIPSRYTVGDGCSKCWLDSCNILCLLIWQAFFIHTMNCFTAFNVLTNVILRKILLPFYRRRNWHTKRLSNQQVTEVVLELASLPMVPMLLTTWADSSKLHLLILQE